MIVCPVCRRQFKNEGSLGGHFAWHHSPKSDLPTAPAAMGSWVDDAACKGQTNLMYADPDKSPRKAALAKQVCRGCPVVAECQRWAIRTGEPHGIWGGLTPRERSNLIRRRARAGVIET